MTADMEGIGRLERSVESLREDTRKAHEVALEARTAIIEHQKSCEHETRRTQEKIDEANRGVDSVKEKLDEMKESIRERRDSDDDARRDRQKHIDHLMENRDERLKRMENGQRRIFLAIVVVAIGIIGSVIGSAVKPFVAPAAAILLTPNANR